MRRSPAAAAYPALTSSLFRTTIRLLHARELKRSNSATLPAEEPHHGSRHACRMRYAESGFALICA